MEPEEAIDALLARTVDVSLILASSELLPGQDDQRVYSEHLFDDVMDVALPFDHPLAGQAEVQLGRPRRRRLDPGPTRGAVLAARPGRPASGPDSCRRPGTTPTSSSGWSAWSPPGTG